MNPDELRQWANTEDKCGNYAVAIRLRAAADQWEKAETMIFALAESSDGLTREQRWQWVHNVMGERNENQSL